ncbi:serine/threonine protein kinase with two-component sensor domain [Tolypothrix tenuis PCC 7101]|uniref:histidine kinase n=1 Tax=Tolypothrix tenuis PCC 7101 TaxID=231146 RepID=A0A1Z4MY53_9CYAN|nr:AAA family ATPase [Aulosira sp. FACHB-113]BAY98341.1 serine/threonine protein kinase with two-component sensor domain [Tolypothrix tenuis PCC 7101]BAZ77740.1 serine/threonine protein kinase with two-component sensor domain [Aulosira laxa NIES-50]
MTRESDKFSHINGYEFVAKLYQGYKSEVYRAIRVADQKAVVIKLLRLEFPSFNELLQFRNQYTIAKNLDTPGIVRPLSLEAYRNSYALVMEDSGGISLKEYTSNQPLALREFLRIALQLTEIIDYLYQNRVIHKDIKPANILIHPKTQEVKLIDFSIASLLPRETQTIISPNVLEGTLAYLSPEQTGRMNRGIDYRSDFYSLGVTFFELLTGKLPFNSHEPMELVHCHIAKYPPLVNEINPAIPPVLGEIVSKLMAKNAEDRYQSGLGLKYDLQKCLAQLNATGEIADFEIAKRDICDRFIIPEKLYGRETEVQTLLSAFDRVANNNSELMLVAGFSGTGKTAVVNEIHKPIVRQHGYFIKGKFDQFNRNVPFSAFVQALRDLMGQLLTESDSQLQQWKTQILSALGDNGQVIIEVIPELEEIIGTQPPVPEISGNAAQNRFNLLFQKFIATFTIPEHPLVIFLDDLQWADLASLKLMQLLMSEANRGYLLIIGAYRDNEVSPIHPLNLTLHEIAKTGATLNTITLSPLNKFDINLLIADTLSCSEELAIPLTELVYKKTKGNPFFNNQFLKTLYEDGLVTFNFELGYWQCDIAEVTALALTDDVVEFMAIQLQKLPQATQDILKLAACIGNRFDLDTLAIIYQHSQIETAADLWKALQEGVILPNSEVYKFYQETGKDYESQPFANASFQVPTYRFLHDRVQQASYSLIPENQKQATHLNIGQLLLKNTDEAELENRIFNIVNQLNLGIDLIVEQTQKNQLAQLNLIAGNRAKSSTAYAAAVSYFSIGMKLLAADSWNSEYDLTLALYESAAESEYLNTNFDASKKLIDITLQQAKTALEKVKVYEIQIQSYTAQNKFIEAIQTGREALSLLGVTLPTDCDRETTFKEAEQVKLLLGDRLISDLANLPELLDPNQLFALRILSGLFAPVYIAQPALLPLKIFTMVKICIQHGNSPQAAIAYSLYGLLLCGMGEIDAGYEFGTLAVLMLERFPAKELKSRVYLTFSLFIKHWKDPIKSTLTLFQEGLVSGLETGNLEYVGYCANCYCQFLFWAGEHLDFAESESLKYCNLMAEIKQEVSLIWGKIWRQTVLNLQGQVNQPTLLIGSAFNEQTDLPGLIEYQNINGICYVYLAKTLLSYFFGDYQDAVDSAQKFEEYEAGATGLAIIPLRNFYQSLSLLGLCSTAEEPQKQEYLNKVSENQQQMQKWGEFAPSNYQHKYNLIEAEINRVLNKEFAAFNLYDDAIKQAKENGYIQELALANELAAKFYLNWGKEKVAEAYMQEAYYCYAHWGAKAKTDDLEKRYTQLLQPIVQQQEHRFNPLLETIPTIAFSGTSVCTNSSSTNVSDALDFTSVLKAAQAISSSIQLDELITNLTRIILENSGAKKSALILPVEDTWQVRAITFISYQENSQTQVKTILESQLLEQCQDVPLKIIYYVKNTQQTVIINNLETDIPGVIGEYMLKHQPKSIICTPIINQGNLVGIIYLENKLTQGVFTNDRLQVLKLLASQAAISLENARMYQQAQQALQDLQQAQLQIVQSEKMSALGNLVAGVAHEMNNPLGFISASLTQTKPSFADVMEHLRLYQKSLPNPNDEIIDHAEEIDLDYLLEDLPKVIDSMQIACHRLSNISTSLRTFSRADKDYKVKFNIHEGIDSTILILKHRLKANEQRPAIEVITNYGNLPKIECFPGQLNQVFMNILANAIDAFDESNAGRSFTEIQANPNQITITTSLQNQNVKISIADNGPGISDEVKSKIFDHLFTTKGVGKGTGLGLAIARQIIVEKHEGIINANSALGKGTEFEIQIPIYDDND